MLRLRPFQALGPLVGFLLISSCAAPDIANPTAPITPTLSSGAEAQEQGLRAIKWKESLDAPLSVSQTIDQSGGTISIPETGLTIEFPAGAVSASVTITVTADQKYVAYTMEPAGTQFQKGVRVTQLLQKTSLPGLPLSNLLLYAAYIADDGANLNGILQILEIEPATTIFSLLPPSVPQAEVWTIRHFSRYILASG